MKHQRLYINIDHIATVRQARRGSSPDPVEGAAACERAGADGITAHLREDRRHIQDDDIERLATSLTTVFNLEIACTNDMIALAERLDVSRDPARIADALARLKTAGIRTSLFIAPDLRAVDQSLALGAAAIELHTGPYAHAHHNPAPLGALRDASRHGASIGLAVHAGHGLNMENITPVASIPEIEELNIGHSVVGRAIFVGLADAVRELRAAMDAARAAS
jgi:pyridoxine 5-phosphate synthase